MGIFDSITNLIEGHANRQSQEDTNALNYRMWQEAKEFNEPKNQVARLKEAGLNPALMYGNGSVGGSTQAPSMEAPQFNAKTDFGLDPQFAVTVQQARLLGEQRELVKEQARKARIDNDALEASPGATSRDSAVTRGAREVLNSGPVKSLGQAIGTAAAGASERSPGQLLGDAAKFWGSLIAPSWMEKTQRFIEDGNKRGWFFSKGRDEGGD